MEPLLADDLVLLLLDDDSGRFASGSHHRSALAAAALVDLVEQGVVELVEGRGLLHRDTVRLVRPGVVTDPVLVLVATKVGEKERAPQTLLERLGADVERSLLTRLTERGVLRETDGKLLGLFPRTLWPAVDVSHEQQVREQVRAVLVDGATPERRTALLIGLLAAVGQAHKVVDSGGRSRRDLRRRAAEVTPDSWPVEALKKAVASQAAATTASTAGIAGATGH
jgi:hypothetical protein